MLVWMGWGHSQEGTLVGVPMSVIKFMRRGYLLGRGGIRAQRTVQPIGDIQMLVGEIMVFHLQMDAASKSFSIPMPTFPELTYLFFLHTYGRAG